MARTRLRDHDVVRVYNVPLLFRESEPAPAGAVAPAAGRLGEEHLSRRPRHLVKKTDPGSVSSRPRRSNAASG